MEACVDCILAEGFGLSRVRAGEDGGNLSPDEHGVMVKVLVDADFTQGEFRTVFVLALRGDNGVFPTGEVGEYLACEVFVSVSVYKVIGYNHYFTVVSEGGGGVWLEQVEFHVCEYELLIHVCLPLYFEYR